MSVRKRAGRSRKSTQVERLDTIEDRMGRLASLLSEVAEALAEHPDGLKISGLGLAPQPGKRPDAIVVHAREWPSIGDIEKVLATWHAARQKLPAVRKVRRGRIDKPL